jgi:hypothetical protein
LCHRSRGFAGSGLSYSWFKKKPGQASTFFKFNTAGVLLWGWILGDFPCVFGLCLWGLGILGVVLWQFFWASVVFFPLVIPWWLPGVPLVLLWSPLGASLTGGSLVIPWWFLGDFLVLPWSFLGVFFVFVFLPFWWFPCCISLNTAVAQKLRSPNG